MVDDLGHPKSDHTSEQHQNACWTWFVELLSAPFARPTKPVAWSVHTAPNPAESREDTAVRPGDIFFLLDFTFPREGSGNLVQKRDKT